MDFLPDPGLASFREEVRAFLKAELPPELASTRGGIRAKPQVLKQWQKILNARGWGAPTWAREHGGTGWSTQQRLVFDEECVAAGAPTQDIFAQKLLGPVMNAFATPGQKAEHMPAILGGER